MTKCNFFSGQIPAFEKMLNMVDAAAVSPDAYCRKYLSHLLTHKRYYLSIYAEVFEKLCLHSEKPPREISLLDFGAGNGMLGIFAKFCGFRNVFINDLEEKFVNAAASLAHSLEIEINGFINGDIKAVQNFFNHSMPDAIAGTDVIEHVYDIKHFVQTLRQINPNITAVFTTASNPKNYFKIRRIKQLQLKDEYDGGTPKDFDLFGSEALEPFLKMRMEIIKSTLKNSEGDVADRLAKNTRGMNKADILTAVENFKKAKAFPPPPVHPTNTCNPLTGSWTERILPVNYYKKLHEENGFRCSIYNGFYDENKAGIKKIVNKILNLAIPVTGAAFAPFIIFVASKK